MPRAARLGLVLALALAACRGVSPEERWFRALADDASEPEAWIEAAERITGPAKPPIARGLRGEALRARTSPSVSDLFARRLDRADIPAACALAEPFARWDRAAALPSLARLMRRAVEAPGSSYRGRCIAALTLARIAGGDRGALREYGRWVRSITLSPGAEGDLRSSLEPMWRYPEDDALAAAAEALFGEGTPWEAAPSAMVRAGLLDSPLLAVPAFRARVVGELASARIVGSVRVDSGVAVDLDAGYGHATPPDDDPPQGGVTLPLRAGDYLAWLLSFRPGAPAFRFTWPEARRDDARAAIAAHVRGLR